MKRRLAGVTLALLTLIADQLSKYAILHNPTLTNGQIIPVLPILNLVLVWNRGVTFGILSNTGGAAWLLLAAIAIAVVTALTVWLWNAQHLITTLAIGAITGGAIGNVTDRLHYGAVVDFIQAHLGIYSFYVFNIGDSAIVCGVATLMAESLLRKTPLPQTNAGDSKTP